MRRARLVSFVVLGGYLVNGCGGGGTNQQIRIAITSQSPPNGMTHTLYAGSPHGFSLTASGGTAPYHWSWAAAGGSSLPAGLNLSSAAISGIPTATGSFAVIVTVTDSGSPAVQQTANYPIQITAPVTLSITSTSPPVGTVGAVYGTGQGFPVTATGGVTPYTWSWTAAKGSSLPPGLSLSNGSISGTPTQVGSYQVILTVTDSELPSAQATTNTTIVIANPPPPVISTSPDPPAGAVNIAYSGFMFKATGGVLPLTWSETGTLPPGMALGADGALSGTPTATGSFPISVGVQDALHQNAAPQDFTIEVDAQLPSFTATGSMQTARTGHTATLLGNGKVLVIGGANNGALASAEVFDPASGQFTTLTGHLMTPRSNHTATLLQNGNVLVTGGQDANGNAIAEAELFDMSTGSFTPTGLMNSARTGHTATLLNDGRVLVAGGVESNNVLLSTAELFDPATGKFAQANGPMNASRAHHAATPLSSGRVLLAGGSSDTAYGDIFDPASNTFASTGGGQPTTTFLTATLLADGRVLLAGGVRGISFFNNCPPPILLVGRESVVGAFLFDSSTASFSATGNMSSSRAHHTATLLSDGKVLVVGGTNIQTVENGCFLKTRSTSLASAELFDSTNGAFALTSSMTTARSGHTATLLANGAVLVIGGVDINSNPLASAELYR